MVEGVRNVDIAGAVHSQPLRHVEPGQCGRAPIAAEACCTCTRKGGNPPVPTNFTYAVALSYVDLAAWPDGDGEWTDKCGSDCAGPVR